MLIVFVSKAQNTSIPDSNFEQALINLGYDSGPLDGVVLTANISGITNLDIDNLSILDLSGIEAFLALETLSCQLNNITNLNVTQNTRLTQLFCGNNQLINLDVTLNTDLQILWCESNQITSLDVTQNTKLISLVCGNNQLTNIDTSNNPTLNVLVCENNQIAVLDVSNNTTLNRFQCANNMLTNIDITNNPLIAFFDCNNNELTSLDISNNNILDILFCEFNQISELDISNNTALTNLSCSNNNLCRLNIKNGNNNNITHADFSSNSDLNCVVVDNPSASHTNWVPTTFTNYVSSQSACSNFVNIDTLNNVITNNSYILPPLIYGNYFTASNGTGMPLFAGNTISSSQTIYIFNQTICNSNESIFNVLITDADYFIPKFFTPNHDGYHDYWQVQDFSNTVKNISVFNSYGKLLKSFTPNTLGWNGVFNGELLESNDYWYVIILNTGEALKGHFTLKR